MRISHSWNVKGNIGSLDIVHALSCPCIEQSLSDSTANPCPMLSTPRNGQVVMTNENLFGSIATYSCDFGFRRIGTGTRQCQPTGIWTETPPGCYGKVEEISGRCCMCES